MRIGREILGYGLIKFLPAAVMFLMSTIYYKYLIEDDYLFFLSLLSLHLTAIQVTAGWLGAAQSFYFAKGQDKTPSLAAIQNAGMRANIVLWLVELFVLLIYTNSLVTSTLLVCFTVLQTKIFAISTYLQLQTQIKKQVEIVFLFSFTLAILTFLLIKNHQVSIIGLLLVNVLSATAALLWANLKPPLKKEKNNQLTKKELLELLKFTIPMAVWCFLFATNSYFDRYAINYLEYKIDSKNYVFTKELTQGMLSLLTAPFIMVAHVRIFNNFRLGNKQNAERDIREFATFTVIVCLMLMPLMDVLFDVIIKMFVNEKYVHSPTIFLVNYLGILILCVSMYAQKGLEVVGNSKKLAFVIASTITMQISLNLIFKNSESIVKFAIINLVCSTLYFILVAQLGRKTLLFQFIKNWWLGGVIAVSILYVVSRIITESLRLVYEPYLLWAWVAISVMLCTKTLYSCVKMLSHRA